MLLPREAKLVNPLHKFMEPTVVKNPDVTPPVPQAEPVVVPEVTTPPAPTPVAPGSKTDSELLLQSLKEEREKRRVLEAELAEARKTSTPPIPSEGWSDEGKAIIEQVVGPLQNQVTGLSEELAIRDLLVQYPALNGKLTEFKEFRKARSGYSLGDAATLFLSENGLTPAAPKRQGLEKPSGGGNRAPAAPTGLTKEDVENLRKNDYKKYVKLLKEGKIPENF